MKILYAAFKYDYADKSRGFTYEHNNFYPTLLKLYPGGFIYFPVDETIMEVGRKEMNRRLIETVLREKPDVLFTNLFTNEIYPKTIRFITEQTPTITINWFSDDQWRFDNFSRFWAPFYDWVTTTDPLSVPKYRAFGYDRAIKTEYAVNQEVYKPVPGPLKYDVTFVGAPHGSRREIVAFLEKNGVDVQCWGSGWPNGRASDEKLMEVFSQSKINLNFTEVSTSQRDFKTILKVLAKVFLRRGINNTYHPFPLSVILRNILHFNLPNARPQIKGRNFEVPGCGGFLLTQTAEDLDQYYKFGKEIGVWQTKEELLEKIQYYLSHEAERAAIAKAGYERTLRDHTYEKRFKEIFSHVLAGGKRRT